VSLQIKLNQKKVKKNVNAFIKELFNTNFYIFFKEIKDWKNRQDTATGV
jgi:hypothetical protein